MIQLRKQKLSLRDSNVVVLDPVDETSSKLVGGNSLGKWVEMFSLPHVRTLPLIDPISQLEEPGLQSVRWVPATSTAIAPRIGFVEDMHFNLCVLGCKVEINATLSVADQFGMIIIEVLVSRLFIGVEEHTVVQVEVLLRLNTNREASVEYKGNHKGVQSENHYLSLFGHDFLGHSLPQK